MPLPGVSVEPLAVAMVAAVVCLVHGPPVRRVGSVGAVRSILTVLTAVAVEGVQADTLPALSALRSCTSVVPSALIVATVPELGVVQLAPPLVELRYW